MYELPKSLEVDGKEYAIRTDFRVVLDIFEAFGDNSLTDAEKWLVAVQILFIDYELIKNYEEAMKRASWFINCGLEQSDSRHKKLYDWKKDFQFIAGPINKSFGRDIRGEEYVHWWTFMGYFNEIGESVFSTIVSIRDKMQKGKKLEKYEQEFVNDNRDIIKLPDDQYALDLLEKIRS